MITRFYVTGTAAYGPLEKDSDIDIMIMQDEVADMKAWLDALQIPWEVHKACEGYENGTFYADFNGIKINFIVCDENMFQQWKYATEKMRELPVLHSRERRIQVFEMFHRSAPK